MLRRLCIMLSFIVTCQFANAADARWCAITSTNGATKLVYPPIARAAHVEGVVILRVNFNTVGAVLGIDPVSGPEMLIKSSSEHLKTSQVNTNSTGDAPCQNLVVIRYRILPENYSASLEDVFPKRPAPEGIYFIAIDAYTIVIT